MRIFRAELLSVPTHGSTLFFEGLLRPRTRPGLYRESAFQACVETNAENVSTSMVSTWQDLYILKLRQGLGLHSSAAAPTLCCLCCSCPCFNVLISYALSTSLFLIDDNGQKRLESWNNQKISLFKEK
jgi:hypothetical protein